MTNNTITSHKEFKMPVLKALFDMGGKGKTKEVIAKIGESFELKSGDLTNTNDGYPRWHAAVRWARFTLLKEELLSKDTPRGIWSISNKGMDKLVSSIDVEATRNAQTALPVDPPMKKDIPVSELIPIIRKKVKRSFWDKLLGRNK